MRKLTHHRGLAATLAVLAVFLGGCSAATHAQPAAVPCPPDASSACPASPDLEHVRAQLESLAVKGRAPKTGYTRDQFGPSWSDDVDVEFGHDGCDTRNNILRRDLTDPVTRPGTHDCVIESGTLHDAYTGKTITFQRGHDTSDDVQIDHIVALSAAWQTGAQQLSPVERRNLANDPRNLQAVDGPTNQRKGDADAATWLPAKPYRCTYVARQVDVKTTYRLWVTDAEKTAILAVLATC
ncbi:HNH endonuclease family protein [Nocardia wallacei]|uniref:HNH endonuclease family protein n=1 Tax=Nocardia wallacei TaxID=480035 RepID=UPI00313A8E33